MPTVKKSASHVCGVLFFTAFALSSFAHAHSADANLASMEVRLKKLPPSLATVIIPNKMYVNRSRGAGVFYMPAIPLTELRWSSATFLRVIEDDLNSHQPR